MNATTRLDRDIKKTFHQDLWSTCLRYLLQSPDVRFGAVTDDAPGRDAQHFAFEVDDLFKVQEDRDRMAASMRRAVLALRDIVDRAVEAHDAPLVCEIRELTYHQLATSFSNAIRGLLVYAPDRSASTKAIA